MDNNKKISIIVPVFNCEKYIEKCIDSIINQTYSNIEIIVINDGSTDGTLSILEKIQDKRIRIYNQDNKGVAIARNVGIEKCRTKYLLFVDADDYLEPDAVSILYNKMIEKDYDIVMGNTDTADFGKIELTEEKYNYLFNNKIKYFMVSWNKLMKKELFNSIRYPDLRVAEDDYIIHHLLEKTKRMLIISDKTYNHSNNPEGLSNSMLQYYQDGIYALRDRYIFLKKTKYEKIAYKKYMNYCIDLYCKMKESKKDTREIITNFRKELKKGLDIKYLIFAINPSVYYLVRCNLWKRQSL